MLFINTWIEPVIELTAEIDVKLSFAKNKSKTYAIETNVIVDQSNKSGRFFLLVSSLPQHEETFTGSDSPQHDDFFGGSGVPQHDDM